MNEDEFADMGIEDISTEEESAPPVEETEEVEEEAEETTEEPERKLPEEKGLKRLEDRINKRTRDYYTEKQRREEAERKLAELEAQKPVSTEGEPTEEQFDYDPDAYQKAMIQYYAKQEVAKVTNQSVVNRQQQQVDDLLRDYDRKIAESGIEDFGGKVEPLFRAKLFGADAYEAIIHQDNGPKIEVHLSNNLELAEKISRMPKNQQIAEIGKLSVKLAAPKSKKITKALDPVKTTNSGGGGLPVKVDGSASMDEIMESDKY